MKHTNEVVSDLRLNSDGKALVLSVNGALIVADIKERTDCKSGVVDLKGICKLGELFLELVVDNLRVYDVIVCLLDESASSVIKSVTISKRGNNKLSGSLMGKGLVFNKLRCCNAGRAGDELSECCKSGNAHCNYEYDGHEKCEKSFHFHSSFLM